MPLRTRLNNLDLKDFRNYLLYFTGIVVEVLAVFLLMGIGFLISWIVPRFVR